MYFVLRIPPGPVSFANLAYKSNVSDTQFYKCWTVCVSYNVFKLLPFSSNVEFPKKSDNFRTVPNTFQPTSEHYQRFPKMFRWCLRVAKCGSWHHLAKITLILVRFQRQGILKPADGGQSICRKCWSLTCSTKYFVCLYCKVVFTEGEGGGYIG